MSVSRYAVPYASHCHVRTGTFHIYTVLLLVTLYYTVIYGCIPHLLWHTLLYCALLYCTLTYFTVLYCALMYSTPLYCTVSYVQGMSGRGLRKLPVKAHAFYLQRPVVSVCVCVVCILRNTRFQKSIRTSLFPFFLSVTHRCCYLYYDVYFLKMHLIYLFTTLIN